MPKKICVARNKDYPILEVRPYGGLKQIGSNMVEFKTKGTHIILDCGILFPDEDAFDINYLIPDFSEMETPDALIISHGHEDHIGAITHFVERFPQVPIYAPPFALELIVLKLREKHLRADLRSYGPKDRIRLRDFDIFPIAVNHSIPHTYGLFFRPTTKMQDWGVFYVSDFKVDFHSPYEDPFDFARLQELSKSCLRRFLLADSTNILSSREKTLSEADVIPALASAFEAHSGRLFITTFASNIHRLQTIFILAEKHKRKVVLYGRSMKNYAEIAHRLGILKFNPKTLRDAESVDNRRKDLVIVASGCQGDFRSALNRIVSGSDRFFKLGEDDLVLFSSKAIPGNERKLSALINSIYELGARALTDGDATIHASGHPGRDDLRQVCEAYSPHVLIPIHGESSFLHRHAEAVETLAPDAEAAVMYNFDTLTLYPDDWEIVLGKAKSPILIQGKGMIERSAISQRRKIAQAGALFISQAHGGAVELSPYGISELPETIIKNIEKSVRESRGTLAERSEEVRVVARRLLQGHLGYRPVVFVHLHGK